MNEYAPRCPFCANVIQAEVSFWTRIGLRSGKTVCNTCRRTCTVQDAHTMGSAYWHWAETFRKELSDMVQRLPMLPDNTMYRALGNPLKEDTRVIVTIDELTRTCLRHHRAVLIEMARGREARLDIVELDGVSGEGQIGAILGVSAPESGSRELEQLVARTGVDHFVLYNYPAGSAEQRVRQLVRARAPRHTLTEAHVAAMHAARHATV
jgi:hypothetical protein